VSFGAVSFGALSPAPRPHPPPAIRSHAFPAI
jgi:hypothetical protein